MLEPAHLDLSSRFVMCDHIYLNLIGDILSVVMVGDVPINSELFVMTLLISQILLASASHRCL